MQTLHDELSRFSLDSHRSSFDQAAYDDQYEDEDDDLDITAELQGGNGNTKDGYRCRLNTARAIRAPDIAGPSRVHVPRAPDTTGARPIKPVPGLRYGDIEMGNIEIGMSRDVSGITLTPSVTKPRGCWQAFVHAMTGMSRA
ncbi:hypothetical protein DOTSEDRAFT_68292 [Dothistroma septosporum NZE10]|uniref:Uncharacterized protein n=1 Tax=Dothistroma septosporum (strain NZE10 / CBS 128990) TaxID=675120 RepID=N1Q431_DOTSN|nr:hypothetical protein DOTSEDRAFT_68292 [Dothistroma septosporum NZE10]